GLCLGAFGRLCLGVLRRHGRVAHDDVVVAAFLQVIRVEGAGQYGGNAVHLAELEAQVGHLPGQLAVDVDFQRAVGTVVLVIDHGDRVPLVLLVAGDGRVVRAHAAVAGVGAVADLAVPGRYTDLVGHGADGQRRALGQHAGVAAGRGGQHVEQHGEGGRVKD